MREYLKKLIEKKEKRAKELRELIKKAETADEVRSLGDTLQAVLDELSDAKEQLDNLDDDGEGQGQNNGQGGADGQRGQEPTATNTRSANPMHDFRTVHQGGQARQNDDDPTNSVEYRTAFMNFVCRGVPIPVELRADATTTTTDVSAVIPTTILHEIVKEAKAYGEIYSRVRHLNIQGGVQVPILSLKPTATWITANTATSESDKQKLEAKTYVSFSYFGLECKVSQTLLTNVVSLDFFQQEFTSLAAEAIVQALEIAIFKGTGAGQPTGILKDSSVPSANTITMTAEEFASWSGWQKKVFAKMKKAYRTGSFVMAQGTFDGYVNGMVDQNGQPIGRVNYGITEGETYRFGGKEVLTVENDVLPDFDSASTGDVVAAFVKLSDYAINSNLQMQVVKWTDHDSNEIKNKVVLICDGKLIDTNGVLLIKKGAAAG